MGYGACACFATTARCSHVVCTRARIVWFPLKCNDVVRTPSEKTSLRIPYRLRIFVRRHGVLADTLRVADVIRHV